MNWTRNTSNILPISSISNMKSSICFPSHLHSTHRSWSADGQFLSAYFRQSFSGSAVSSWYIPWAVDRPKHERIIQAAILGFSTNVTSPFHPPFTRKKKKKISKEKNRRLSIGVLVTVCSLMPEDSNDSRFESQKQLHTSLMAGRFWSRRLPCTQTKTSLMPSKQAVGIADSNFMWSEPLPTTHLTTKDTTGRKAHKAKATTIAVEYANPN